MDPDNMNLRQLRVELKRIGLSPSGSKADLVRRFKVALGQEDFHPATFESKPAPVKAAKSRFDTAAATLRERQNSARSNNRRKTPHAPKVILSLSEEDEDSDDDSEEYPSDSPDEEDSTETRLKNFEDFKRRVIGLNEQELERRKRIRFGVESPFNVADIPPQSKQHEQRKDDTLVDIVSGAYRPHTSTLRDQPNLASISTIKKTNSGVVNASNGVPEVDDRILTKEHLEFFSRATLELDRVLLQRRHERTVSYLQNQLDTLREELETKNQLINRLRWCVADKDQTLDLYARPPAQTQRELFLNFQAISRMFGQDTAVREEPDDGDDDEEDDEDIEAEEL